MSGKQKYRIKQDQKHYMRTDKGTVLLTGGQVVELYKHQARAIRDKLIPVEQTADQIEKEAAQVKAKFEVRHVGGGRYSVFNVITNIAANEETLSKEDAKELAEELNEAEKE